jgi:hypothetical protein
MLAIRIVALHLASLLPLQVKVSFDMLSCVQQLLESILAHSIIYVLIIPPKALFWPVDKKFSSCFERGGVDILTYFYPYL